MTGQGDVVPKIAAVLARLPLAAGAQDRLPAEAFRIGVIASLSAISDEKRFREAGEATTHRELMGLARALADLLVRIDGMHAPARQLLPACTGPQL